MKIGQGTFQALVLNADYQPLSYFPLSLWPWQNAIKAVFLDRVNVVDEYKRIAHSPNFELNIPSVISLKNYVKVARCVAFTRFNVFLRDGFSCQYCGQVFHAENLTFDHVIPRCKGGRTTWGNVVTACSPCNLSKGDSLHQDAGMDPLRTPNQPSKSLLQANGRAFPPNYLHESWHDFLYWDTELETN
jgi:5-methylcytosine-specific restriction endonuclease McrA